MEDFCEGLFNEAEWFLTAEGEFDTMCYGSVLETNSLVPVRGVGEPFSGVYYVTKVKHRIKPDQYIQEFSARRNALAPASPADFGGGGGLL